jgi:hypothetical protein
MENFPTLARYMVDGRWVNGGTLVLDDRGEGPAPTFTE